MKPYPLMFEPILKEKVWGGRRLGLLGRELPEGAKVGESWEIADLGSTSASGGGGGEARSVIANGEMRGLTLADAIRAWGANLMGSVRLSAEGGFPLLVKYLDASENLSVQVHPSAAYAARHSGAHLKTESWYVVDAAPGAVIYKGVKPGVTREGFVLRHASGALVDDLVAMPVQRGDVHHLPSGTVHALGAGVMVAEVQTPSDTTFRVYDWGRKGRELHVEAALECIDFSERGPEGAVRSDGSARCGLGRTSFYALSELRLLGGDEMVLETPEDGPVVWMVLEGEGRLECTGDAFAPLELVRGATVLLPATLATGRITIDRDMRVLEARLGGLAGG